MLGLWAELPRQFFLKLCIKIMLGIKLISLAIPFCGIIPNECIWGMSLYAILFAVANVYRIEWTKASALIFVLGMALYLLVWIVFYCILCFSKKKRKPLLVFFLVANIIDALCALRSVTWVFSQMSLIAIIYSFSMVVLITILLKDKHQIIEHDCAADE